MVKMKDSAWNMLKFALKFCVGTSAMAGFTTYGLTYFYFPDKLADFEVRNERDKVSVDSSRFMKQWTEKKSDIRTIMRNEEEEFKNSVDPKSEELPELLQTVLDILDGKVDETSIDLTKS